MGTPAVPNPVIKFDVLCFNTPTDFSFFSDERRQTQHRIVKSTDETDLIIYGKMVHLDVQHLFPYQNTCTSYLQLSLTCLLSLGIFSDIKPDSFHHDLVHAKVQKKDLRSPYSYTGVRRQALP